MARKKNGNNPYIQRPTNTFEWEIKKTETTKFRIDFFSSINYYFKNVIN